VHGIKNEISLNKKKVWWLGGRQTPIHKLILFNYTSCGGCLKRRTVKNYLFQIWNREMNKKTIKKGNN